MLAKLGVDEATARERSIPWLVDMMGAVQRDEAAHAAATTRLTFVAVQAAQHGGEAFDAMDDILGQLDAAAAGDVQVHNDADAVREMRQRGIGYHERVNVSGAPE